MALKEDYWKNNKPKHNDDFYLESYSDWWDLIIYLKSLLKETKFKVKFLSLWGIGFESNLQLRVVLCNEKFIIQFLFS